MGDFVLWQGGFVRGILSEGIMSEGNVQGDFVRFPRIQGAKGGMLPPKDAKIAFWSTAMIDSFIDLWNSSTNTNKLRAQVLTVNNVQQSNNSLLTR